MIFHNRSVNGLKRDRIRNYSIPFFSVLLPYCEPESLWYQTRSFLNLSPRPLVHLHLQLTLSLLLFLLPSPNLSFPLLRLFLFLSVRQQSLALRDSSFLAGCPFLTERSEIHAALSQSYLASLRSPARSGERGEGDWRGKRAH